MTAGELHQLLERSDRLQRNAAHGTRVRYRVDHATLQQVHRAVNRFGQGVETGGEEDCRPLLRALRRFVFLSAATPLPFDHPLLWPTSADNLLNSATRSYQALFPELHPHLTVAAQGIVLLRSNPANPIGNWLEAYLLRPKRNVLGIRLRASQFLVVSDPRVAIAVDEWIETQDLDVRVATASSFSEGANVDLQIYLGSTTWFPAWCFTAPRSDKILVVQNRWLWDRACFPSVFGDALTGATPIAFQEGTPPVQDTAGVPVIDAVESVHIEAPHIDWAWILGRERGQEVPEGEKAVQARLHALQGGKSVWLQVGEDETVQGLCLDAASGHQVQRLNVDDLKPGEYVLLRTNGAGDFLDEFAGQILVEGDGQAARAIHQEWKRVVRQQLYKDVTVERSVKRLKSLGAASASEGNLRHWGSNNNLRPRKEADFRALVEYAAMTERIGTIEKAVAMLKFAQQSAGQQIGRLILQAIREVDIAQLQREGHQNFGLPGGELGGTFTAYAVRAISPEVNLVAPSRLGRVIEIDGEEY